MGNLWSKITGFFDKYLIVGLAGVIVVLAVAGGVQSYRLSSAKDDLASARTQISRLNDTITTQAFQLTMKDTVTRILENRTQALLAEQREASTQIEGIKNAPAEEDGDVSDVLCRAVSGTKCLRNNSGKALH